jgi:hypothetical protein
MSSVFSSTCSCEKPCALVESVKSRRTRLSYEHFKVCMHANHVIKFNPTAVSDVSVRCVE